MATSLVDAAKRASSKAYATTKKKKKKTTTSTNAGSSAVKSVAKNVKTTAPSSTPSSTGTGTPTAAAPNLGAVGSNSNGSIALQTNLDIENMILEARQELALEEERANRIIEDAILQKAIGLKESGDEYRQQRGRTNAVMASRGMKGTANTNATENDKINYQKMLDTIRLGEQQASLQANSISTGAKGTFKMKEGQAALARKAFTDTQSKNSPTVGTTPIESGLKAIEATPVATPKAAAPATLPDKAAPAKKKYKGKYPGPDKFKGDAKKLAIHRAAKRKVGKK